MKKIILLLLSFVLLFSACSQEEKTSDNQEKKTSENQEKQTADNLEMELIGNDEFGYLELPKGSNIKKSEIGDFYEIEINGSPYILSLEKPMEVDLNKSLELSKMTYSGSEKYEVKSKIFEAGDVFGFYVYRVEKDDRLNGSFAFKKLNEDKISFYRFSNKNDKNSDGFDFNPEQIVKSFRFGKDEKALNFKETDSLYATANSLFGGVIEYPSEIAFDKNKKVFFEKEDDKTQIVFREHSINATLDEYTEGSIDSLKSSGAKIDGQKDVEIAGVPGRVINGLVDKKIFSSIIYSPGDVGMWFSWTVESDSKEKVDKWMDYIINNHKLQKSL